ncbi:TPA: conjugation system SOS inhibitor PsiB [Yersinia enterocolitica]
MTKQESFSLVALQGLSPVELEQYWERGTDYRQRLSSAVLQYLNLPSGWLVDVEYGREFGGVHPVSLRVSPTGMSDIVLNVCSAGEENEFWTISLPFDGGESRAWVCITEYFDPNIMNKVLAHVAEYYKAGFQQATELAKALHMEGIAV